MAEVRIDDAADPRLGPFAEVRDGAAWLASGRFVVEGRRALRRLLDSRFAVESLLLTEAAAAALADAFAARPELTRYVVRARTLRELLRFRMHQGALGAALRAPLAWRELLGEPAPAPRRLLLLERVADPDNVGACFRSARAFGVDAVLIGFGTADPLYRKAIRTSLGATLLLPWARVAEAAWPRMLEDLRAAGFRLQGLAPEGERSLFEAPAPARQALLLGNEGDGLDPATLAACDDRLRIEMVPEADSINAAASAAVALAWGHRGA